VWVIFDWCLKGKKGGRRAKGNTSKIVFFGHMLKNKKSTHPLFGAWSLPLAHVSFTPPEGPQRL
jgi:hypothetical protein